MLVKHKYLKTVTLTVAPEVHESRKLTLNEEGHAEVSQETADHLLLSPDFEAVEAPAEIADETKEEAKPKKKK